MLNSDQKTRNISFSSSEEGKQKQNAKIVEKYAQYQERTDQRKYDSYYLLHFSQKQITKCFVFKWLPHSQTTKVSRQQEEKQLEYLEVWD